MGTNSRRKRKPAAPPANTSPPVSVWTEGVTQPIRLCFHNKAACKVDVSWVTYDSTLQKYSTINPQGCYALSSYSTHAWVVSYEDGHSCTYIGGSGLLVVLPGGRLEVKPYQSHPDEDDCSWQDPAWGAYKQQGSVLDLPIMAYECVSQAAVQQVVHVVTHMLQGCCPDLLQRLVEAGCNIAIIARHQKTTDIPPHHFMKYTSNCEGARDIDATTRGLGATPAVPTTSCGEENLLMQGDRRYPSENILIHEFGHAVMNLGLSNSQLERVQQCYSSAKQQRLYDLDCYMMENADEYWAEGVQTWFDATVRTDVNSGINTRDKLKAHDPDFAALLAEVFGDGHWRYPQTAPAPFGRQAHKAKQQQQQQQQPPEQARQRRRPRQQQQQQLAGVHKVAIHHDRHDVPRVRTRSMASATVAAAVGCASVAGRVVGKPRQQHTARQSVGRHRQPRRKQQQ